MLSTSYLSSPTFRHPSSSPRFKGDPEYQAYLEKFKNFSSNSISRLAHIKQVEAAEHPNHFKHILLSGAYGAYDSNISWLNTEIQRLIKLRGPKNTEQNRNTNQDLRSAA